MNKLSKSDIIDKEQEAKDREWLATKKVSQHFAVGTYVISEGIRYRIEEYSNRGVIVTDEDGFTWVLLNPYFRSWE